MNNHGVLILYATSEGQTGKVTERLASRVQQAGHPVEIFRLEKNGFRNPEESERVRAAINRAQVVAIGGSLHAGSYQKELVRFVRQSREILESRRSVMFTVALTAIHSGSNDSSDPDTDRRGRETSGSGRSSGEELADSIRRFEDGTGWKPDRHVAFGGAVRYTRYNPMIKFIIKRIALRAGLGTDTSRDHDYTDWDAVDRFADELSGEIGRNGPDG